MGYSPWGRKESDMTEQLIHIHTYWVSGTGLGAEDIEKKKNRQKSLS